MFGIADNHEFLAAIGIENAPNRDAIIADLENWAQQALTVKISERLTTSQVEELNSIEDEQESAAWIAENLPELPDLVTETFAEIKNEILSMKTKVLSNPSQQIGIEKGEIITLNDNKEYVCLSVITAEENRTFLYLMTTKEPLEFCFAEESFEGNAVKLRIVGGKEEKLKLFELLKEQTAEK